MFSTRLLIRMTYGPIFLTQLVYQKDIKIAYISRKQLRNTRKNCLILENDFVGEGMMTWN